MALLPGTKEWILAEVVRHAETPRSYVVQTKNGKYRRNRHNLHLCTAAANDKPSQREVPDLPLEEYT